MNYSVAFLLLIALCFQIIIASPVPTEEDVIKSNKRFPSQGCTSTDHTVCPVIRDVEESVKEQILVKRFSRNWVPKGPSQSFATRNIEEEREVPMLAKRFSTSATCPPGAHCLHRRDVAEEVAVPNLVKRGHHHGHHWGFGKHGFRGWFRGWRHHGRFW